MPAVDGEKCAETRLRWRRVEGMKEEEEKEEEEEDKEKEEEMEQENEEEGKRE